MLIKFFNLLIKQSPPPIQEEDYTQLAPLILFLSLLFFYFLFVLYS